MAKWELDRPREVDVLLGACLLLNRKAFHQVAKDFCQNAALVFFAGMFALIVGVVIIITHNLWEASWAVMITIIGWIGLIKGVWMIALPNRVAYFMQIYQDNESLLIIHSIAALILGMILTYFGFLA